MFVRLHYFVFAFRSQASNLTEAKCWDNVVDFRWHRTTPSPPWHMIAPSERANSIVDAVAQLGWEIEKSSSFRYLQTQGNNPETMEDTPHTSNTEAAFSGLSTTATPNIAAITTAATITVPPATADIDEDDEL